ncbi:MAG: tRNA (N(6)-L-threonylcarbamoyladenosine(37)-C(2))-methylthiotransferase MtaB [Dehalococcoidales bacterium]|nr:MAG: tRNA (N(6)-L-threonylcarbamoyladenosine(37)-C(2))-methylthiotransferase MtaB [Dehalococcoidales bacterium]
MKVVLETLGCKLNQAETELLARELIEAGYQLVSRIGEADIYILNTCTVTHIADSKSRHRLRQAHRRNPNALILATGCYAQRARQELACIGGVNLVVDNNEKGRLLRIIEGAWGRGRPIPLGKGTRKPRPLVLRTRTFIKIQDGCNTPCSYCIVPRVRGRETSLPTNEIITEVSRRVDDGYQEVVLTATKTGTYQHNGIDLKGLLERILVETGVPRLRLSSLQPQEISSGLLGLWADDRLCPHFHLSLQSGSDPVLARMRRRYDTAEYEQAVSLIRESVPDAAITTDVIVGFPGETDEEFKESYRFCKQMEFARIHVFPFSPRSGTEAAQMPAQVDPKTKKQHSDSMLTLAEESARNFRERFSGRTMTVLWEQRTGEGIWSGVTGNYIRVFTKSEEDLSNQLMTTKLA